MLEKLQANLPYIFFMLSGYLLIFHQDIGLMVSAAMFYGVGCVMLVTRSAVHRLDLASKRKIRHHMPEVVYEYYPYWILATAVFLLVAFEHAALQFLAFIMLIISLRNLVLRHNNRVKLPSKF